MKNTPAFLIFFLLVFLNALMCGMGIFASLELETWYSDPVKFVKNPPAISSFPIFPLMTLLIILLMILSFIFARKLNGHLKKGVMITVIGTFILNIIAFAYFIPVSQLVLSHHYSTKFS